MLLEVATEADLPEIVDLINMAYRGTVGWTVEEAYIDGPRIDLAALREDLAKAPEAMLMVHREEGRLLGCVWLEPTATEGTWYLGLLSVRPDLQQQQLGRRMLAASEEFIKARGGLRVRMLVVNIRDTLVAWYERRGYALTGETKPFPYGDNRFGTPTRDDLAFVVLEKPL